MDFLVFIFFTFNVVSLIFSLNEHSNAAMLIRNVYCNFCFLPHAPHSIAQIPPHTVPHASSSQQFANPIRDLRYGHARLHSFPRHPSTVSPSDYRFYFLLFVQKACGHYNASSQLYIKQRKAFGKLCVYVQTFWASLSQGFKPASRVSHCA